jgi:hypothetical protein
MSCGFRTHANIAEERKEIGNSLAEAKRERRSAKREKLKEQS